MTETRDAVQRRVPWHFWVVCIVAVLWNGFGGCDFTMSLTQGDTYYRSMGMTEAQIASFHSFPVWAWFAWGLGVWGAIAGTVLLLIRSRYALPAFVASLLGLLASLVYTHALSDEGKLAGTTGLILNGVILAGCLFFIWYARRMARQGVLR
jgi:hypothetical protein